MSDKLSKEEYLFLINKFANEQYDQQEEPTISNSWMPAESEYKERMNNHIEVSKNSATMDATKIKRDKILDCLRKYQNIKLDIFLIRIEDHYKDDGYETLNLYILEEKRTTPSGHPAKMQYKINLLKDDRFSGRTWLSYSNGVYLNKIPIEIVVDVVRWVQGIIKLKSFL